QYAALLKKRRLRRIHIFCSLWIRFEQSAAECDHFANIVANRKHDPVAKTIVNISAWMFLIAWLDQSALQKLRPGITAADCPFQKCVPVVRRKPELPIFRHLPVDSAVFQISPRRFGEFLF